LAATALLPLLPARESLAYKYIYGLIHENNMALFEISEEKLPSGEVLKCTAALKKPINMVGKLDYSGEIAINDKIR
jgi:hypothetical protein